MFNKKIDLNKIDFTDETFLFSYPIFDKELENSIKNFGIINAIIVEELNSKKYRIISGFKRAFIAKKLRFHEININILKKENGENFSDFDKLNLILDEKTIRINNDSKDIFLNEIEKANFIHKIFDSENKIFHLNNFLEIKELCKNLGFTIFDFNIHKKNELYNLPEYLKDKILGKKLSIESAINLVTFNKKIRIFILDLIENLNINFNFSKEIIENLKDIYKIYKSEKKEKNFEKFVLDELLNIKNASFDDKNEKNNISLKIEKIRNFLDEIKNPNFFKNKQKFELLKKNFEGIDKNLKLNHFPYFEKENLTLTIEFKDLENFFDLKNIIEKLKNYIH